MKRRIYGNTVGTTMPKPDLMQDNPNKGDFVKGKEEFLQSIGVGKGDPGFSPIAKVTETADGVEISVTDEKGTTTATVKHGKDGEDGKPFVYDDLTEEQKDDMKPARGKDYWTEDDVAQMEAYLDKAVGQKVQIITWEADD